MTLLIQPDLEEDYQVMTMNLPLGEESIRVTLELRYLYNTEKWYVSLFDTQSGEPYFTYIPLIASYNGVLNDLWGCYSYKGLGQFFCIPNVDEPSTQDPERDNLNEFSIYWSDGNGNE